MGIRKQAREVESLAQLNAAIDQSRQPFVEGELWALVDRDGRQIGGQIKQGTRGMYVAAVEREPDKEVLFIPYHDRGESDINAGATSITEDTDFANGVVKVMTWRKLPATT